MEKDILKGDLIDPKRLDLILLIFFGALSIWMLWTGYQQYSKIDTFFEQKGETKDANNSLEVGNILLTRIGVPANDSLKTVENKLYASVFNLDHQTSAVQKKALIVHHQIDKQPVYGLAGPPSFIINPQDISFWRSQMYWQTLVDCGGLFLISILFIIVYESKYRKDNKLFIAPVKNSILAVFFLLMTGVLIKWGLNYRLVHFLNDHFYISHIKAPFPNYLYYIAVPVLILGVWLEQAVRLQKEQDLTI